MTGVYMYEGVGGYGGGAVGVGTTTAAAIILPNTGSHWVLTALAAASLFIGLVITISSVARIVAKHTI